MVLASLLVAGQAGVEAVLSMDTQHTPRFLSKDEASVLAICAFPTVFARFTATAIWRERLAATACDPKFTRAFDTTRDTSCER